MCRDAGEDPLAHAVERVAETLGQGPNFDFNVFLDVLKADMSGRRAKLTAKREKLLQTALAERDEKAERVSQESPPARHRARSDPGGCTRLGDGSEDFASSSTNLTLR